MTDNTQNPRTDIDKITVREHERAKPDTSKQSQVTTDPRRGSPREPKTNVRGVDIISAHDKAQIEQGVVVHETPPIESSVEVGTPLTPRASGDDERRYS